MKTMHLPNSVLFKICIIGILLFQGNFLIAQEEGEADRDVAPTVFGNLSLVYESIGIDNQFVQFACIDDTNDSFFFADSLGTKKFGFGINFGIDFTVSNNWVVGLEASASGSGSRSVYAFGIGLGKSFDLGGVYVVPKTMLGMGSGNIKLGKMNNWDTYIEIDDLQFYGEDVDITLKTRSFSATPQIDIWIPAGKKGFIRLNAGYKLGTEGKVRVKYSGYTDVEETETGKRHRKLDYGTHQLIVDGTTVVSFEGGIENKVDLIKFTGPRFQIGYVWSY